MKKFSCFKCNTVHELERVGFRMECDTCSEDLHVCKNCEFYDESSYNECREPNADRILEKERSNLCEFFAVKSPDGKSKTVEKTDLMNAAEALFKK